MITQRRSHDHSTDLPERVVVFIPYPNGGVLSTGGKQLELGSSIQSGDGIGVAVFRLSREGSCCVRACVCLCECVSVCEEGLKQALLRNGAPWKA